MTTPPPSSDGSPLLPAAGLPRRIEQHLRESLTVLRDQATDPAVRRRIDDVLAGRASMRDLARDDAFSAMMAPLVERGMARMDALSPEERARVAADAEALERGEPVAAEREDERAASGDRRGQAPPPPSQGTW